MHSARSGNGFGLNAISYTEIYCYFNLIDMKPEEWELDLIRIMDKKVLNIYAKETEKELNKK